MLKMISSTPVKDTNN